jgi:predicted porin
MTSLKKLIAVLAISLPLAASAQQAAAPAAAPAPLAQIYGTLNLNLQAIGAGGAKVQANNVENRWAVSADSSNIGVKGTASVAGGFGVVYQCETSAKLDGYNNNVTAGNIPRALAWVCDRNSRVGLSHAQYGTLFLGNWDTPFKAAYYGTKADDPFGNTDVFGANNILGSPGFNVVSGSMVVGDKNGPFDSSSGRQASFDLRAQNSIAYWTPKIMGLGAKLQWSTNEFATPKYYNTTAGVFPLAPMLLGAAINYDDGPLSVVAAWEQHRDMQGLRSAAYPGVTFIGFTGPTTQWPLGVPSIDTAWRVAAGYEIPTPFGPTTVAAVYEQLIYTSRNQTASTGTAAGVALTEFKRPALGISAKHRYGDHELRARFNWADKGSCKANPTAAGAGVDCSTSGLDAHEVTLGYAYYLASSTQVFAFWTKIVNGANAAYTPGAGGSVSGAPAVVGGTPAGADPEAFGVGMRYAF